MSDKWDDIRLLKGQDDMSDKWDDIRLVKGQDEMSESVTLRSPRASSSALPVDELCDVRPL